MKRVAILVLIRAVHSLIWLFFNVVIFYLLYAVLVNRIGPLLWIGLALFAGEGLVLLLFGMSCPLTILARKYSGSQKENFDIYLPEWLAKYNKTIYTSFLGVIIAILIFRLITNH
ncbi:MAG: hypothetical protein JST96_01520 [Bacteroidetes bacterium]|nr:hypothetical protein [Bacteroidota bacterium]